MTPLSDALTVAQRRALAALEKAYVAGQIDDPHLVDDLASFGITDPVDVAFLRAAWAVLREWGVTTPTMTERVARENGEPEPMTAKQREYLFKLAKEKRVQLRPAVEQMTKQQASEAIEQLQAGTYDEQADVPF